MAKLQAKFKYIILLAGILLTLMLSSTVVFSAPDIKDTQDPANNIQTLTIAENKRDNTHFVATTMESVFNADDSAIWKILIDFKKYPTIFKRIESVQITKDEDGLVYTESRLKPGLFVQRTIQHTVNDLRAGPNLLDWHMLDGNFKFLKGQWEIKQLAANKCNVKYTLLVDVGPLVPAPLINFVVHQVQREIVTDLKHYVEAKYKKKDENRKLSCLPIRASRAKLQSGF